MPDYLITMDTGERYLAHHGVKGMKWGKWNPETAARYAGGKVKGAVNTTKDKISNMSPETKQKLKTAGKIAAVAGGAAAIGLGTKYGIDKLTSNKEFVNKAAKGFTKIDSKKAAAKDASWYSDSLRKAEKIYNKEGNLTPNEKKLVDNLNKAGINKNNIAKTVSDAVSNEKTANETYKKASANMESIHKGVNAIGKNSAKIGLGASTVAAAVAGKKIVDRSNLRDKVLKSNDPTQVRKGMELLSNEELRTKLSRMELENRVDQLYTQKEKRKYEVKGAKREARRKTLSYDLTKQVGQSLINRTIGGNKKNKKKNK